MNLRSSALVVLPACALASLFSCVGDEPATNSGNGGDAASDGSNGGDASPGDGATVSEAGGDGGITGCTAGANCVEEIAAAGDFACARMTGGTVRCWGSNIAGERGDGLVDGGFNAAPSAAPSFATGISAAVQISAGAYNDSTPGACALLSDAASVCWGDNSLGRLGQAGGGLNGYPAPTMAGPLTEIRIGGSTVCGAEPDGGMVCWGQGAFDNLGGPPTVITATPQAVPLTGAVVPGTISTGSHGTIVLQPSAKLLCWGEDGAGQCADDAGPTHKEFVTEIEAIDTIATASFGFAFTCAAKTSGEVWCWGVNSASVLGVPFADAGNSPVPLKIQLPAGRKATHVSAGDGAACAILDDNTIWCWGTNDFGVAGTTTGSPILVPQQISGITGKPISIASGNKHACALFDNGTVACWGANNAGQLGRGGAVDNSSHATAALVVF